MKIHLAREDFGELYRYAVAQARCIRGSEQRCMYLTGAHHQSLLGDEGLLACEKISATMLHQQLGTVPVQVA